MAPAPPRGFSHPRLMVPGEVVLRVGGEGPAAYGLLSSRLLAGSRLHLLRIRTQEEMPSAGERAGSHS